MAGGRLLGALRAVRRVDAPDVDALARELLAVARVVTESARVTLEGDGDAPLVHGDASAALAHRIEQTISLRPRTTTVLRFERDGAPYDDDDLAVAEAIAGEIALRLVAARASAETKRAAREQELIHALAAAGAEMRRVSDVAERAARETLSAFSGAHVALHVAVGNFLELVARRVEGRETTLDDAPPWLRRMEIDGTSVQALAARTREIVARPFEELAERARIVLGPAGVRHVLVAPLVFAGELLGTLTVVHRNESPWHPEALAVLERVAEQLAVALRQARLFEEERSRADDLEALNQLGSLLAVELEQLDVVLRSAVEHLARITGFRHVDLLLADAARTELATVARTADGFPPQRFAISDAAAVSLAFRTREPVVVEDALRDPRASRRAASAFGTRAVLAVPLVSRGEPIGAIAFVDTQATRSLGKAEIARATAIANLLAPVIVNAKMLDDLRKSYDALARAQAELVTHERLAALGELSAVMAHEVRNPLAVIFNSLGALRRFPPANDDARMLLDILGEEAMRLNRLVDDLLDFVKPYASRPRPTHVPSVIRASIDAAIRSAPGERADVASELHLAASEIVVDDSLLQQALLNLVVNAVQATPPGGTVLVRAEDDATELRIDVADQGPGIDAGDAPRIFEPFFTTKPTGTGLGLAVVRRIAGVLGGRVELARSGPEGSVFRLRIPIERASP